MKGKTKKKRKIGKIILIGMSFFLTILLTFTTTLAWFYDSDWASKYIKMGGTVGISIRDNTGAFTSGTGNLHFILSNTENTNGLGYPGQSVDVSASCYNDGGRSTTNGSECYVRARFAVYTNIGKDPNPNDYITTEYPDGTKNPDYIEDVAQAENDKKLSASSLYSFLNSLIDTQNSLSDSTGYRWVYYKRTGSLTLTDSGTASTNPKYYLDGNTLTNKDDTSHDRGYFYLCENKDASGNLSNKMKKLAVGSDAVFLWNNTFTIPWQLTNASAGKYIYVGVIFQAVQTYIPVIDGATGTISQAANNQLPADDCLYNDVSVQTVFNTCTFKEIPLIVNVDGVDIDFGSSDFDSFSDKDALTQNP